MRFAYRSGAKMTYREKDMVQVTEVSTRKQRKQFVEFPLKLYKNCKYFVPPLYGDEMDVFKKDYMYYDQSEAKYFLAYRDGKVVGRISAILQHAANDKWGQKRMRFTRFDAFDDQEAATALFAAVENWAKERGLEEVVGPLGFSDWEREGLLIDGFDYLSTFEEQYNYPYYQRLIENCGYTKDVDWLEHRLYRLPEAEMERFERVTTKMMERYGLRFDNSKNTDEFIKLYADKFFEIVDKTYNEIYGTVPFTDNMKRALIANFRLIIDIKYVTVILDKDDNVVAFGLCFPGIGEALQKSGGKLTLPCLVRLLKLIKHPKVIDMGLIGVVDEYKHKGIASAVLYHFAKQLEESGVEYAETNLNLEDNLPVINLWKNFDHIQHKRRRSFVKKI